MRFHIEIFFKRCRKIYLCGFDLTVLYWSSKTGLILLRRFKVNRLHTAVSSM